MAMNSTSTLLESIRVVPVKAELVPKFWPFVKDRLQKAIARGNGELSTEAVYDRLVDGRMQLLLAVEGEIILAAFVTEVVQYPMKKALRIVLGGGVRAEAWKHQMREMMRTGAKAVGATTIEAIGRKGWLKLFPDDPAIKLRYYVITEELA